MLKDHKDNTWLVTEYIYGPDGPLIGILQQRHTFEAMPDQERATRVTQHYLPLPEDAHKILELLSHDQTFEMKLQEDLSTIYMNGGNMVSSGRSFGGGIAVIVNGIQPQSGYNFTSYSVRVSNEHQVVIRKIRYASQLIATAIGVAIVEQKLSQGYPTLSGE